MKIAVSMWSYVAAWREGGFGIGDFIRAAKEAGADGVELLDFFYRDPADPWRASESQDSIGRGRDAASAALAETGLPVVAFSVANDFALSEPAAREGELLKIRFGIAEARRFGAPVVRVFAGDVKPGVGLEEARAHIVAGLAAAAGDAADAGVSLALENHGSLAGRADLVRGLIEDVRRECGNDALGANPDTGNFLTQDEDPVRSVRELARYAGLVHLKDFAAVAPAEATYTSVSGVPLAGRAVGEGDVDLAGCLGALRDAGYGGVLSIEYEGSEPAAAAIPRSVAAARRLLAAD